MLDFPAGTTPGTGPQCTEAWNDPSIPVDGSGCILGAATFEDGVGALIAIASCAQLNVDIQKAKQTCSNEDAANCNSDGTCNFGGQPEAAAPAPQSQCDTECLCANYPDTAQGCNTNFGPCVGDYQCSGGYTCQATSGGGSHTCQAPDGGVSDDGGTGDDGGAASGDDAGTGSGDDAGDPGSGDDGGVVGQGGDDGGSGDPGSGDDGGSADPGSGDDGGAGDDPAAPPTDQQLDQDTTNETCPSCQGNGTDINADPSNGGVSTTSGDSTDPTGNGSGSTSDQNDDGTGGGPGAGSGGGDQGGSSGGGVAGGGDGTGDATQDQPAQDQPAQDQATQDQPAQDQATQDQPAQDQATQDQPAQDQPAQDATQDAIRPHHHRHHKKSGWKRLYDKISGWLQQ
jgi:hypothetical protein